MKKITLAVFVIIIIAVAYFVWLGARPNIVNPTPPTPSPNPATPAPVPSPALKPALTSGEYNQELKTFTREGISIQYPISWILALPNAGDDSGQIASIISPNTKSNLDAGLIYPGYNFDVNIQRLNELNPQEYIKGESVKMGGKDGYRVVISGAGSNEGVVVEQNNSFYVVSFQPDMSREWQDTIIKHISFTK